MRTQAIITWNQEDNYGTSLEEKIIMLCRERIEIVSVVVTFYKDGDAYEAIIIIYQ